MTFTIIQNEKAPLQAIKTRSLRIRKIDIFLKGLTHGFGQNKAIFPTFFFGTIGQQNDFFDILDLKNAFLGSKNKKFQKSKNLHFSKGVNPWFWSQYGLFSNIFFSAILVRKMIFTIFQIEKMPFQAIKTSSSKSRKIDIFPKGLTHDFGPKMPFFHFFFFRQYRPGKCLL